MGVASRKARLLPPTLDVDRVVHGILEREATMAMRIGNGVAVPHAHAPEIDTPISTTGVVPAGLARRRPQDALARV
jgi:hypothetical protein